MISPLIPPIVTTEYFRPKMSTSLCFPHLSQLPECPYHALLFYRSNYFTYGVFGRNGNYQTNVISRSVSPVRICAFPFGYFVRSVSNRQFDFSFRYSVVPTRKTILISMDLIQPELRQRPQNRSGVRPPLYTGKTQKRASMGGLSWVSKSGRWIATQCFDDS